MKSLIIGAGEVGSALYHILKNHYPVILKDKKNLPAERIKILHICYPWSDNFLNSTRQYIKEYSPKFCVIHSTVPIGTSKKLDVFHSPIRGVHPRLIESLKIFVKYLAPPNPKLKNYFEKAGISIEEIKDTNHTEALKLWETTQYGLFITLEREIYRWCQKEKLDFDIIYTRQNQTYNKGYLKLGIPNVVRPILKEMPGPIGGHCIVPNCQLLKSKIAKLILKFNKGQSP